MPTLGPVFRYKKIGIDMNWLGNQVGTAPSAVVAAPLMVIDVTMYGLTQRDDLDYAMLQKNWEFLEENPANTPLDAVKAYLGL